MSKKQIQQKQKANSERESNQTIVKDLKKAKRKLEKENATLRTINLELEAKLHSSNRHRNNKNSNNCHQSVKTKESQNIWREKIANKIAQKSIVYMSFTYFQKENQTARPFRKFA